VVNKTYLKEILKDILRRSKQIFQKYYNLFSKIKYTNNKI